MKILIFAVSILVISSTHNFASEEDSLADMEKILQQAVEEKRESAGLVGLGAVVIQDAKVIGLSVSGKRRIRHDSFLAPDDRWHIGSVTKSFTATMIARLVEKGILRWNTSIKEVFAEHDQIHSSWHNVTLDQLLTHTSGAKPNFSLLLNFKNPDAGIQRMVARESAVKNVLKQAPQTTPGEKFEYSNVGYTIAGVMAEKKTEKSWEQLISEQIFAPLGIQSGGFGVPKGVEGELHQPWGHQSLFGFSLSSQDDNTPIIGPAGTIHLSLKDLALYGNEHLQGLSGKSSVLQKDSFQRLHHPKLDDYAYGWVVDSPNELDVGRVHWHNGSNTMWYALLVILPDINAVVAVTSNDGKTNVAEQSAWEIIEGLAKPLEASHRSSINFGVEKSAGD